MTTPAEYKQAALRLSRESFPAFCMAVDPRYSLTWLHRAIGRKMQEGFERLERGEDVRLMVFMPPRHGKSDMCTQKLPAWILGRHPEWPVIVSSYAQELSNDFGQNTRDLMASSLYADVFDTKLREDTQAKAKWMTREGGGYTAVGVGGPITGRGFKVGIVDDPFKNREEADSPVVRDSVHKWWRSTFYTRQEGSTMIVLILTRWHDDDLAGRLLREEAEALAAGETNVDRWDVLRFPAIAEADEPNRLAGTALWPEKFPLEKLLKTKASLGGYEFSAIYQQNPIDVDAQEFRKEWIRYRTMDEVKAMATRAFATIDPAGARGEDPDGTGVTRNWVNADGEYHFATRRYRINSRQMVDLIFDLHGEGMEEVGIEAGLYEQAIEPFFLEECRRRDVYPRVVALKHGGVMKETRIRGLIPRYENGRIFHISGQCADLEEEMLRFPKSAKDDCLDSAAYQAQIAEAPSASDRDRLTAEQFLANVSKATNGQAEPIVIGVSSERPARIAIGNRDGLFFHQTLPAHLDPWPMAEGYLARWRQSYAVGDLVGDALPLRAAQQRYPGRISVATLRNDSAGKVSSWGDGERRGTLDLYRNAAVQQLVDELRDGRMPLSGSAEDWAPVARELAELRRSWETTPAGEKVASWSSPGPTGYLRAILFCRAGLDRYSQTAATVVGAGALEGLEQGRFFESQ